MPRWATVLAGGSGTRFWPLSTPENPKQFLSLAGDQSLLRQTVERLRGVISPERILIVTGERYADRTRELLPDIKPDNVLAEPKAASTGPALTWASHHVRSRDPDATMVSVHADWHVVDVDAFRRDATSALAVAEEYDMLVTIGVVPTRAEQGYGYIVPGEKLSDVAARVERFVEKPTVQLASSLIEKGGLWNCGLFAWKISRFFQETDDLAQEIAPHMHHLTAGRIRAFFDHVTPVPIDISHFERSAHVAVVRASFGWDDVGTWDALSRVRVVDADGNVKVGSVQAQQSNDCIVWSPGERVALFGVSGLVVTRAHGITLITTRERASQLKDFVERLPEHWREP